ncbi:MAG: hypothetical protein DRJ50_12585, partial [Actinobacteria bacterium]
MVRIWAMTLLLSATALPASAQWSTATMPQARIRFAATATDGKLYIAGGLSPTGVSDVVDVLQISTGSWTQLNLSGPRQLLCAASVGHEVFFGGGVPTVNTSVGFSDTVDIYDELTGTWSIENLPVSLAQIGAGSFGTKVYFAGGGHPFVVPIIQVFDTLSRTWTVRRMSGPGHASSKVLADERWLCIGAGGGPMPAQRLIDIYDSWSDSWTQIVAPEDMVTMALGEGRLQMVPCLFGPEEKTLHEYDLEAGVWSTRQRPTVRCHPHSDSIGPFLVLAHGFPLSGPVHGDVDVYNRVSDEWRTDPLSVAASRRATAVHGPSGSIFLIGGDTTQTGQGLVQNIDIFRPDRDIGTTYCSPAPANSSGQSAHIEAVGTAAVVDNWFTLGLTGGPPGQFALFL